MTPAQRALVDPPLLEFASPGITMRAIEYPRLEQDREVSARNMCLLHRTHDVLITPQLAVPAFEAGTEVPRGSGRERWREGSPFTYPFNLSQQPAATVPCGFTRSGLPVAMQIAGDKFADATVLRAARAYEAAHPFRMPKIDAMPGTVQWTVTGVAGAG